MGRKMSGVELGEREILNKLFIVFCRNLIECRNMPVVDTYPLLFPSFR
jgi:hypothetical protein